MGLRLFRSNPSSERKAEKELHLNKDPYGEDEKGAFFDNAVDSPEDIETKERRQDMEERLIYADRAFFITCFWVFFLILLPLLQLYAKCSGNDGLTDASFIAVITTTTASVFGFWMLVGRYLFEPKNSGKPKPAERRNSKTS